MTMDQYEIAVAEAIAARLFHPVDLMRSKGIQIGRTVLREGGFDLDEAHGTATPEAAAAEALDLFGEAKRAARAAAA